MSCSSSPSAVLSPLSSPPIKRSIAKRASKGGALLAQLLHEKIMDVNANGACAGDVEEEGEDVSARRLQSLQDRLKGVVRDLLKDGKLFLRISNIVAPPSFHQ